MPARRPIVRNATTGRRAELEAADPLLLGLSSLDASGLTAARAHALPDASGTLALLSDITGGSGTTGEILFDFGAAPGSSVAVTTVTESAVGAGSVILIDVLGTDSTATHNAYEHTIVHLGGVKCSPVSRTAGVGFTAHMYSLSRLTGVFKARYSF